MDKPAIPNIKELEKALNGDKDLVLFFLTWIKNGQNATKAYRELHPDIDPASGAVLGSRLLKKVNTEAVLATYGLGINEYFNQLGEGIKATKWNDYTGEREADHKTRKDYHNKLGKLLGIERDGNNQTNIQVNIQPILGELKAE